MGSLTSVLLVNEEAKEKMAPQLDFFIISVTLKAQDQYMCYYHDSTIMEY